MSLLILHACFAVPDSHYQQCHELMYTHGKVMMMLDLRTTSAYTNEWTRVPVSSHEYIAFGDFNSRIVCLRHVKGDIADCALSAGEADDVTFIGVCAEFQ